MSAHLAALQKSGRLRRVDARLGEWLARAFPGTSEDSLLAAALAARAISDGHSALTLDRAQAWLDGLAEGAAPALPEVADWRAALQAAPAVHVHAAGAATPNLPLVLDAQDRVYLRRYFEYERQLARMLVTRAARKDTTTPSPRSRGQLSEEPAPDLIRGRRGDIPASNPAGPPLDPEQQRAIDVALSRRFTLVTGGPGTGKTHVVLRMLAALAQRAQTGSLRIALAAPTGKAAARLGESLRAQLDKLDLPETITAPIPHDAQTVHSLLGVSPWRTRPRFDRTSPLPFDVVVVDEVSMVDLPLMAKLVQAVPDDAKLILLGDPDQLSAVEAGNVLGALVEAAGDGPLRDCHVALTRSHRFGADSALGALAAAITLGDATAVARALDDNAAVTLVDDPRAAQLVDIAADAYRPILSADGPAAALHAARGFRMLTALRHGPSGCLAFDRAIAQRLQRNAGARGDEHGWPGRLILVTANRPELGLFNGDTGVIWPDADGSPRAWFEAGGGTPRALPVAALPPHEGAFALTVHKAQGSEFERVALVTGPDSAVLTRELLYTGVTRARTAVTLYSSLDTLRAGIERRTLRMTGLADRLREAAGT
ncbi:MAG: exodeoxyribonuclease V subunit alpha [Xanthomonadales bacterium]|nr:exodeoxyribonuclease V subunit alpha [Xanthomonadales bacterium]ODU92617.1 MAG: exodeoxyribonuclease V subunit alpha [Rhodanobacter sp. SCN 66-43]OJY85440.1 MAG: exodeoxyribonuclease V subunit alpha [Xanthomonadales bacterium 66-474]